MALLLLPTTSVATDAATATAHVTFLDATLGWPSSCAAPSFSSLQLEKGPGNYGWAMNASSLRVNWTRFTYLEHGHPTNFSQPYGEVAWNETSGEDDVGQAISSSVSDSDDSQAYGEGDGITLVGETILAPFRDTGPFTGENFPQEVPPNAVRVAQSNGTVILRGDFLLRVWNSTVVVHNATGQHGYRSGNWTEPLGPIPPGVPHPVRYRHYQTVRLVASNATLELQLRSRPLSAATTSIGCFGNFTGIFTDARGDVGYGGNRSPVAEDTWQLVGEMMLSVSNETLDGSRLSARIEARPEVFGILSPRVRPPEQSGPSGRAIIPSRSSPMEIGAGALAFLAVAAVGLFSRRRRVPRLEDIEWALLSGRPTTAARLAKRRLRLHTSDHDTIFLYGASFLARGKTRQLVRRVEPYAIRLPVESRRGPAYLLAMAYSGWNRAAARRWAAEARADPDLHRELQRGGFLKGSGPLPSPTPGDATQGYA